jgi:hypothetical protein
MMSEALARVRSDSILVRPAKAPRAFRRIVRRLADNARVLPARVYVGSAFSALLVGIGVNALLLQRERHPAPLFRPAGRDASPRSSASPVRPPASANLAPAASTSAPAPPHPLVEDRPQPLDQIGELLREVPRDNRGILAAQSALARLGYRVKLDGVEGVATEQALRDFERSHGLPVTTDLTPRLAKELTMAARAAGR